MTKYIIQRIIWIFVILISVLTITFVLLKLAPEYPPAKAEEKDTWLEQQYSDGYYTREYYDSTKPSDVAKVAQIRIDFLDQLDKTVFIVNPVTASSTTIKVFYRVPIADQYFRWLGNIVTEWNWGTSSKIKANYPAFAIIAERMPTTFKLNIAAMAVYLPIGFSLGIVAALNKDSWIDNLMQVTIMVFLSVPSLILILVLMIVFAYRLEWFDSQFPLIDIQTGWDMARGYVIPVTAMSLPSIAGLTRLFRAELSEVLTSEFVLLAKTKGLSHRQAVLRHAIRNSFVPMVPVVIATFASLLGGSFIIESVYAIPGVGRITLEALRQSAYDYNVIMVSGAFYGIIGLTSALLVDLSYGIIDPQIRMGAKK